MQRQRGVQECLRHCIADELRARAIAQVGMLPPDNSHELTQNRNRVLEVLQIPEVRKIRLQAFFKGDIRTQGIDVYLPADTPDINQALDVWSVAASWALYPKAIKVFQTQRWSKNIEPINESTLLLAFHDVLPGALLAYLDKTQSKRPSASSLQIQLVDGMPVVASSSSESTELTQTALWAAVNEKARVEVREYVLKKSLPEQMTMAIIMAPAKELFKKIMEIDASSWEEAEHRKSLQQKPRSYRILEANRGRITHGFWQGLHGLFWDLDRWQALKFFGWSLKSKAMAFASSAKLGGSIFFYLDMMRDRTNVFQLIDPTCDFNTVADTLLATCKKVFDPFTVQFMLVFDAKQKLASPEAMAVLVSIALSWFCSTGRIEGRHAEIRRLLKAHELTRQEDWDDLSADFVLARQRSIQVHAAAKFLS